MNNALDAAQKSIEMNETHFIWDTISLVYQKMGNCDKAIESEKKALNY